ncbi:MAG TPA: phosphatidylserine decarboxylase [Pyrinomonadaceae bacterium]
MELLETTNGRKLSAKHQYIDRRTQQVCDETLFGDKVIRALYSRTLERAPILTQVASSQWVSNVLASMNYSSLMSAKPGGLLDFLRKSNVDLGECVDPLEELSDAKKLFERKIKYWECRPMPKDASVVVCPSDSRAIVGSMIEASGIVIKEKFFNFSELLSVDRGRWLETFADGDFAVFRLTPEKYHYVHTPVSGRVEDFYDIDGRFHSCNPGATISLLTPFSKNRRVVTIVQTDAPGGSGVGAVAIIEVVALMVGQIEQRYSSSEYSSPKKLELGMFLKRGQPKSLFRPGSSTVILLFQRDRVKFVNDLILNRFRPDVASRYSLGFKQPIVETDVAVRSALATSIRKRDK